MASSSIKSPPPPPYPYDEKMYSQYRVSEPWGPDHPEDPATVEKLCSHLRKKPDFHQLDRGCVVMISSLSHCERCVQVRSALGQYIHVPRTRMALGETVPLVCYFCNDEDFQMSDVKEAFKVRQFLIYRPNTISRIFPLCFHLFPSIILVVIIGSRGPNL